MWCWNVAIYIRIIVVLIHRVAVTRLFLGMMQEVGQDPNYAEVLKKYRARHLYELKKINRAYRVIYSPEDVVYKEGEPSGVNVKVNEKGEVTEYMTSENGDTIELLEKSRVFLTEEGKVEEQKISPTVIEIIPLNEGYTMEPEDVASDDIVETSNQGGSLRGRGEAGVESDNMFGHMSQENSRSLVFRRDGEDWSIVQPSTDTGSQEEEEIDLKGDFGKPEHVDNFLMIL